jgi:penicillin-binding protein 2
MLNRATNPLASEPDSRTDRGPEWMPNGRLAVLFGVIAAALLVVAGRMVHVQAFLTDDYVAELTKTREKFEPIPALTGRILSAEGIELARDVRIYNVTAHYRWLEMPPDEKWLRGEALSRLDPKARKNPDRVRAEMDRVLAQRQEMWERLAAVVGRDPAGGTGRLPPGRTSVDLSLADKPPVAPDDTARRRLITQRAAIQQRVERVFRDVAERLAERRAEAEAAAVATSGDGAAWYQRAVDAIRIALTTPPQRGTYPDLEIEEQLAYHTVIANVPHDVAVEIESHPERYPGLRIEHGTRREYPHGWLAPHIVGYRQTISAEELIRRRIEFPDGDPLDYEADDRVGVAGLERQYERHLRGLRGERRLVVNRRGAVLRSEIVRQPRDGRDLQLTLHAGLQAASERLLDETLSADEPLDEITDKPLPIPTGGSLIALDVRTGAVLAAVSAPGFDVNDIVGGDASAWERISADRRKPMFSRTTHAALPPGSVFKVLTATALLQTGIIQPERDFFCQGYLNEPDRYRCMVFATHGVGHGDCDVVSALARSCNVYFFAAARRAGSSAEMLDWASRFGFGQPTGIDLPGEARGNLPKPRAGGETFGQTGRRGRETRAERRVDGDTLGLAIGQATLTVTPLQVVRMMAAVANGGQLVTPHLAETAVPTVVSGSNDDATGRSLGVTVPDSQPIADLSRGTLEWVRRGLRQTVEHPQGTGFKTVRMKEVSIAGKTGTAETGGGRPEHAWFAGYVPADNPRVAFVVVLEHAGSGGHAAGPAARKFVHALLDHGVFSPRVLTPSAN